MTSKKTARQQYWFDYGQRDYARGVVLSFDNPPDHWTDLEAEEAESFYRKGQEEGYLNAVVDL